MSNTYTVRLIKEKGLTLIELIVVIFVIGIITTVGLLRIGFIQPDRIIKNEIDNFSLFLDSIRDESILGNKLILIKEKDKRLFTYQVTRNERGTKELLPLIIYGGKPYFNVDDKVEVILKDPILIEPTGQSSVSVIIFKTEGILKKLIIDKKGDMKVSL